MRYKTKHELPRKLSLPEAAEILVENLSCQMEEAHQHLGRAIYEHSLESISMITHEQKQVSVDIGNWGDIDWDKGIVVYESADSGSPATFYDGYPMLDREEFFAWLPQNTADHPTGRGRGGRPAKYDWDRFWIEVCRRVHHEDIPNTQKALVDEMLMWFADSDQGDIDDSTIRKKISKLFAVLRSD